MKGKRTGIDFSKHELHVTNQEGLLVHHLKIPDTYMDSIKYINTNGILAVTGDYSNWIFCREFHPSAEGYCSDDYWMEKLMIGSCQEGLKYSPEETEKEIKKKLEDPDYYEYNEEDKEYLTDLLTRVDDELEYTYYAYRQSPSRWDSERVIFEKEPRGHFLFILDGFEEICRRIKETPAPKTELSEENA